MELLESSDSEVGLGFEGLESLMACLLLRGLENEGDGFGEFAEHGHASLPIGAAGNF